MAVDLPAIVVEEGPPMVVRSMASLSADEARAARAFREATGLALAAAYDPPPPVFTVDPGRSARLARIEATLHAARGPLELGDREALPSLRSELAAAYGEARAHPEDPEAPLLVAELLRTMARAEDLGGDPQGASALRARAALLDGGRKIGLSEGAAAEPASEKHPVAIAIHTAAAATTWVDGVLLREPALALADGEHHLRVVDDKGATVLARWIAIGASTTSLAFEAGARAPACSSTELAAAARAASFSVSCASWAIVRRAQHSLEVRVCGTSSCGASTHWGFGAPDVSIVPVAKPHGVLDSPWTWVAASAVVVAGGAIAAWRLGAFDRPEAPPPTWRWEGARRD